MKLTVMLVGLSAVIGLSVVSYAQQPVARAAGGSVTSFYDLKTKTLEGKPADLAT